MNYFKKLSQLGLIFLIHSQSLLAEGFDPLNLDPSKIDPSEVIKWHNSVANVENDKVISYLQLSTVGDFGLYKDAVKIQPLGSLTHVATKFPEANDRRDPVTGNMVPIISQGTFAVELSSSKDLASGTTLSFDVTSTACSKVLCLFPYTKRIELVLPQAIKAQSMATQKIMTEAGFLERATNYTSKLLEDPESSLLLSLFFIFLGGLLSNLSPCVYPMIPITLRILSVAGHPVFYSFIYGLGIVITYTSLGLFAGMSGSIFGAAMQSPVVNIFFAVLMFFLAMTMLGFGQTGFLQQIGQKLGAGKPSVRNTFLMGIGAGFVAAPCVGPLLVALLALAAKADSLSASVSYLFVYSLGFACPYVFLGATAAKISQRSFGPKTQVFVKILFAAIIFALAFYYLRIPFYQELKLISTLWPYIASVALALGLGLSLILLSKPTLWNKKLALFICSFILGLSAFAFYQYSSLSQAGVIWLKKEVRAFEKVKRSGKPLFVDGWAEWCEACKTMDKTTFQDPLVVEELNNNWVSLKLDLTEMSDLNDELTDKYSFGGLPSYALISKKELKKNSYDKKIIAGFQKANVLLKILKKYRKENKD